MSRRVYPPRRVAISITTHRGGSTPPRCVTISITTRRGGSTPLDVSLFLLQHVEEGLPPLDVCYSRFNPDPLLPSRRGEGVYPSPCRHFPYDTLRRVYPPRRVTISVTTRPPHPPLLFLATLSCSTARHFPPLARRPTCGAAYLTPLANTTTSLKPHRAFIIYSSNNKYLLIICFLLRVYNPYPPKPVTRGYTRGFDGYGYGYSWRYPGVTRAIH